MAEDIGSRYGFNIHFKRCPKFISISKELPYKLRALVDKKRIITAIISKLSEELELYIRAARASHAEATHEQSKAENKYDTRGLEAAYLARGQSRQIAELELAMKEFRALPQTSFPPGTPIGIGTLVELREKKQRSFYFVGPRGGGAEVEQDGVEILVITPQSPLGAQLMGRKAGEKLKLQIGGVTNDYTIVAVQ
jgi:transcription elongation GreA/GreB family factor